MKKIIPFLLSVVLLMNYANLAAQADAPTDFTTTPVGISLACHLAWTNPATTIAGDPLTQITKIVIERNNEIIKEIANPAVGAPMNFTDNTAPATGTYHYVLYAVTNEGKGLETEGYADIGNGCYFRFVMKNLAYSSQGWKGSFINITVNGIDYCTVTLQGTYFAEETIFIPSGTLTFTWVSVGTSDEILSFEIYNPLDELLFVIPDGIWEEIGMFLEYENQCNDDNNECDPATNLVISANNGTVALHWEGIADSYAIMKNGTIIKEITETHYLDAEIEDGFYSYCIIANYSDCISFPICDDIMVLGVLEHKDNILVYPNPATNLINISGDSVSEVKIYNNLGQLILTQHNTNAINVSALTNGIYILSIKTLTGTITQTKIIINH